MRIITVLVIVAVLATAPAFASASQTVVLELQNFTCPLCRVTVKKALENVHGVSEIKIDVERKTATVKFDPAKADTAALVKATTNAGFPSTVRK